MNITLSHRVQRIQPSPTLAINARASALKAKGHDIINLSVGEPDFDTPLFIKEAAIQAIQQGVTKYTAVEGTIALRNAIVKKFQRDNQIKYDPNQILVSCGGKQSFFNLTQALLDPEDEVIIPTPYWVSFADMVLVAEATPVFITTEIEQQFKITPKQLEKAITPKTRLLVLNSPSNPTGMAYTEKELKALGEVLRRYPDILIASDDIYEHIYWRPEPFTNLLMCCPDLYDRTILLNGVSKTYAMTGWRIGYAAGPLPLITAMTTIQSQSTSNACSISQAAATAALNGDQSCIQDMVKAFKERHDFVVQGLNQLPGVECLPAHGTFYAFPRVQTLIDKLPGVTNDIELAEFLLETAKLALVPGSAFGAPGYIRLSFATQLTLLKEALNRLQEALAT